MACKNFTVLEEGLMPFENVPVPNVPPAEENVDLMEEGVPFVQPGQNINSEEITELRAQGITVDDDDEPDELNAQNPGPAPIGTWGKLDACRRASQGHLKLSGRCAGMTWQTVAEMDELQLFMLCFPMDYLKNTVLPETNKYVSQEITLQEFFVFLGCLFNQRRHSHSMLQRFGRLSGCLIGSFASF
jgi:hypothetical protein